MCGKLDFLELFFWDFEEKRWIWNLGSECWLGSILAKGSFRSAGGLSNNEHAKRRQRNGRSICTHLKFIQKSLMIALITIFFSFMRITIVKECSPYCAKVIFSNKEKQPCNWAYIQFASPYHDLFQQVPSYLLWKWVCIDVVGVECGEALDYNVGECRPG